MIIYLVILFLTVFLLTWFLSLFISILIILSMYNYMNKYPIILMFIINVLMFFLLASFLSFNALLFYFFFECSLIPTFFLILGWGNQPERIQASIYFMFYTLFASLPLLLTLVYLTTSFHSLRFFSIFSFCFEKNLYSVFICIFMFMAFFVKLPVFIFHLWLPKAHVEAPVAGSIILAGVLLKLGVRYYANHFNFSFMLFLHFFIVIFFKNQRNNIRGFHLLPNKRP